VQFAHRATKRVSGCIWSFSLSEDYPERGFQEWIDAYWAKDIQELFRLERPYRRSIKDVSLKFIGLEDLVIRLVDSRHF